MNNGVKANVILEMSYQFAPKIIAVYKDLSQNKKEVGISKQLLRSAASIGENPEEANTVILKTVKERK